MPDGGISGNFNDLPDGGVIAIAINGVIYYFQVDYGPNDVTLTPFTPSGPPAWKHQAGPVARNAVAIFGTKGTGAEANNPGARQGAMNWLDDDGDLWMLGGYGYAQSVTNPPRYLNDLWRYDRSAGQWIWVSGANVHNQFGTYGSITVPAADNTPGGRHTGTTWKDTDGDLWLFGGYGIGTTPGLGRLNDLWRFDTGTGQWAHMKGSNVRRGRRLWRCG
jgi:N-acetylneuraminic acid mutarotase